VKRAFIGGIGNVLLGDDGVGPYVVRLLESRYCFGENVEIEDLGTPALDLTHRIVGLDTLILVDCVAADGLPGTIRLYHKEDLVAQTPAQRLDPHSPALSECLLGAEMLGASPANVLLVGVVGASFEPGCRLSPPVQDAVEKAIAAVLDELQRRGIAVNEKEAPDPPGIWWNEIPQMPSPVA
jgi:hydrogenase maturation protease